MLRFLTTYEADKGSFVANGVAFNNGIGDGQFNVYYSEYLPEDFTKWDGIWFDLRECNLVIWLYDCCGGRDFVEYTKEQLGCEAVEFAVDRDGNICVVKYF